MTVNINQETNIRANLYYHIIKLHGNRIVVVMAGNFLHNPRTQHEIKGLRLRSLTRFII